jgi:hypothetical protein
MTIEVPAPKKSNPKGSAPSMGSTTATMGNNTTKPEAGELVALNFKVSPEFRADLKMFAAMHSMSMTEILKEGFEIIKKTKGS